MFNKVMLKRFMSSQTFESFQSQNGFISDCDPNFPSVLHSWNKDIKFKEEESSFFGFVQEGQAKLKVSQGTFILQKGMYFSFQGEGQIEDGQGIIIEKKNYKSYFNIGGPVEPWGRLKYIDGCTDSLLIPPIKQGDPCLNALFFPPLISQTQHEHPSDRIGVVYKGTGRCILPGSKKISLESGMIFRIRAGGIHSFETSENETMIIIAYHPDSDFGPTDKDHPMINRTIVNKVSASFIDSIRTK